MAADPAPVRFQTSRGFQFFYLLPLLLAAAALTDALINRRPANWPIVVGALLLAVITVPRALARVELDGDLLRLYQPLRAPKQVALRQLCGVERSRRMGHTLLLRYYPLNQRGQIDLAEECFLGLPPLEQQVDLETHLFAAVGEERAGD